jgi:RNA polymerase sigma-70 factor (ECF subfamily)
MMREQLEELYRTHLAEFQRTATAIAGDRESGKEAVQEGFAKAIRARRQFRGEGSLDAWVWKLVVNAARDARRREQRHPRLDLPPSEANDGTANLPLAGLTSRQAEVLFLHYYADLSYATIAEALGIQVGTVGATLHTAREALRRGLTSTDEIQEVRCERAS